MFVFILIKFRDTIRQGSFSWSKKKPKNKKPKRYILKEIQVCYF